MIFQFIGLLLNKMNQITNYCMANSIKKKATLEETNSDLDINRWKSINDL